MVVIHFELLSIHVLIPLNVCSQQLEHLNNTLKEETKLEHHIFVMINYDNAWLHTEKNHTWKD